jgi:AcrR family transcriptional regulator
VPCRWRRRREARPGEILRAALELFVEHGFAATTMEEIACRAGVTKGTVYLYYTSKEVLFQAVVEDAVVPTISLGEQLLAVDGARAPDLFRALIAAWWDFMSAPPVSGIPKLLAAEAVNFPAAAAYFVEHVFRRGRVLFRRVLELGIERGEFRPDLDLESTARLALAPVLWALVHRHSLRVFDEQPLDLERFLAGHVDVFLRGIAAESQHGRG